MLKEREHRLDAIGFVWSMTTFTSKPMPSWNEKYQRLELYSVQHKSSTNVPRYYEEDAELGVWVQTQRTSKKRNKLLQEEFDLLNRIDFLWSRKPQV